MASTLAGPGHACAVHARELPDPRGSKPLNRLTLFNVQVLRQNAHYTRNIHPGRATPMHPHWCSALW